MENECVLSGPMFRTHNELSESICYDSFGNKKSTSHYNIFWCASENGMKLLKKLFPQGKTDDLNFVFNLIYYDFQKN